MKKPRFIRPGFPFKTIQYEDTKKHLSCLSVFKYKQKKENKRKKMTTKQIQLLTIKLSDLVEGFKDGKGPKHVWIWREEAEFLQEAISDSSAYHSAVGDVFKFVFKTAHGHEPDDEWIEDAVERYIHSREVIKTDA